jgi:peptidoglycan-N-acetylglucosamine deacetylase
VVARQVASAGANSLRRGLGALRGTPDIGDGRHYQTCFRDPQRAAEPRDAPSARDGCGARSDLRTVGFRTEIFYIQPPIGRRLSHRVISMTSLVSFWFAFLVWQLIGCSALALSQNGHAKDVCWSVSGLNSAPGETFIRRHSRRAFVSPPSEKLEIEARIVPPQVGVVRRVDLPAGTEKLIALTFDLCEVPDEVAGYQGDIVDFLRADKVRATFFAGGKWLLTHQSRAEQLMSDPFFEVANHTWDHRNLRLTSGSLLQGEIGFAQLAYDRLRRDLETKQCVRPNDDQLAVERVPKHMTLFRFPFGACDARSLEAVAAAGLTAIQWDVSSGDPWIGESATKMTRDVLRRVHPGSIVLFHANGRGWHTAAAIGPIVRGLRSRGYRFVTVSELLHAGNPVVEQSCYDVKPSDTSRYDRLSKRLEERYRRSLLLRNSSDRIGSAKE